MENTMNKKEIINYLNSLNEDDEWIVCHKQIPTDKSFITIEQDLKINWVKPF